MEEGKNSGADGWASQLFGFSWKTVLSCCLVVAVNFSPTLAKILSNPAVCIWMVYRPVTCRSARTGSHTAFRHDIATSYEISASDFSAQEKRNHMMPEIWWPVSCHQLNMYYIFRCASSIETLSNIARSKSKFISIRLAENVFTTE